MANNKKFIAKNGVSTGDGFSLPSARPSTLFDFSNGKNIDPRLDFTRGSVATYYDGYTKILSEENLFAYSEDFDQWTDFNATVVDDDQVAPDGTTTAASVTPSNATNYVRRAWADIVAETQYTLSVYLKAPSATTVTLKANEGDDTFTTTSCSVTTSWQRFSVTLTTATSVTFAKLDIVGTNGEEYYVWGAQAERDSTPRVYTKTTGQFERRYQPVLQTALANVARIDHDPATGECKGLRLEQQVVNHFEKTNPVSGSNANEWSGGNATNANYAVAPDGSKTAAYTYQSASGNFRQAACSHGTQGSKTVTFSLYVKLVGANCTGIRIYGLESSANNRGDVTFNLVTGAVTASSVGTFSDTSGYTEEIGNGWYRVYVTTTTDGSDANFTVNHRSSNTTDLDESNSYLWWGLNVTVHPYGTSFIAADGSEVTRNNDVCKLTVPTYESDVIPFKDFSFVITYENTPNSEAQANGRFACEFWSSTGTTADRWLPYNLGGYQGFFMEAENVQQTSSSRAVVMTKGRTAVRIQRNNVATSFNGEAVNVDTSCIIPKVDSLAIGSRAESQQLDGTVYKLAIYNDAFDDATIEQLAEITV